MNPSHRDGFLLVDLWERAAFLILKQAVGTAPHEAGGDKEWKELNDVGKAAAEAREIELQIAREIMTTGDLDNKKRLSLAGALRDSVRESDMAKDALSKFVKRLTSPIKIFRCMRYFDAGAQVAQNDAEIKKIEDALVVSMLAAVSRQMFSDGLVKDELIIHLAMTTVVMADFNLGLTKLEGTVASLKKF